MIYRTRGEHANHYATDAVHVIYGFIISDGCSLYWKTRRLDYYIKQTGDYIPKSTNYDETKQFLNQVRDEGSSDLLSSHTLWTCFILELFIMLSNQEGTKPLENYLSRGEGVGIQLIGLNPQIVFVPVPRTLSFIVICRGDFNVQLVKMRSDCFVDISWIDDHYCLIFLFIKDYHKSAIMFEYNKHNLSWFSLFVRIQYVSVLDQM